MNSCSHTHHLRQEILISDESFSFKAYHVEDPKITGAQIAELVGKNPVADYVVLQHLATRELESLRPTEIADLTQQNANRFFVIKSGELFRFLVEGLTMEWPLAQIRCAHVKTLAGISECDTLMIEGEDSNHVLSNDDTISLKCEGVEKLRLRRKPSKVKVKYGDVPFELERRSYTTEELLAVFSVPSGYKLDLINEAGEFTELKPCQIVEIKECLEFASHPPRGQSS